MGCGFIGKQKAYDDVKKQQSNKNEANNTFNTITQNTFNQLIQTQNIKRPNQSLIKEHKQDIRKSQPHTKKLVQPKKNKEQSLNPEINQSQYQTEDNNNKKQNFKEQQTRQIHQSAALLNEKTPTILYQKSKSAITEQNRTSFKNDINLIKQNQLQRQINNEAEPIENTNIKINIVQNDEEIRQSNPRESQNSINEPKRRKVQSDIVDQQPIKKVYLMQEYEAENARNRRTIQINQNQGGSDIPCQFDSIPFLTQIRNLFN